MRSLLRFSALLLLFAASLPVHAQTVIEEIIVRVNDSVVTRSDLQRARDQLQQEMKQGNKSDDNRDFATREKDLLRDLIDQKLLVQRGKDDGITVDNELIKRLDEIRKQNNLESMEDLEKAAREQGVSFEDFKEQLRISMMTQKVVSQDVGRRINITPTEVHAYYEKHKDEMKVPEMVRLAEILVSTEPKPNAQPVDPTAAEAKAKSLLEQLRGGAKFEELAKKSSDDASASQAGDLGYFKAGDLAPELEKVVFAMKPGDVSDPIQTKQGYILLKVLEKKAPGVMTEKEAENQIQERIYYEKLQPAVRDFLTQLREEAYIDIKPGFVDTGASAKQSKPIMAEAIADPGEQKQNKPKKKLGVFK
jgi:peptidyl-prolyl cis-trans isomerase SurA